MKTLYCLLALVLLLSCQCYTLKPQQTFNHFLRRLWLLKQRWTKSIRLTPLFDGKSLDSWNASVKGSEQPDKTTVWTVKDGALASLGAGRGVLYTDKSFGNYRIIFTMRHISGTKDHQACVLIYCSPLQNQRRARRDGRHSVPSP